jgi:hypothetical protein
MDRKDGKASELSSPSSDGVQGESSGFRLPLSLTEGPLPTAQPFRMTIRLATRETHLVDLLDRILDKGSSHARKHDLTAHDVHRRSQSSGASPRI